MTSNIGSDTIYEMQSSENTNQDDVRKAVMDQLRQKFKPEFLNRIDDIILFHPLTQEMITYIVDIQLQHVVDRLKDEKITLNINKKVKEMLAKKGFDPLYGARPLKRVIQHELLDSLAMKIIDGTVNAGDSVVVKFKENNIIISVK
jgi:ATP-dependent Clp protease ATP-binding subunit ClpA